MLQHHPSAFIDLCIIKCKHVSYVFEHCLGFYKIIHTVGYCLQNLQNFIYVTSACDANEFYFMLVHKAVGTLTPFT